MGDAGSLFLGFMVGGLALAAGAAERPGTTAALILPALIVLVPIVDTAFVAVHRFVARRPIAAGRHRPHVAPPRRRRLQRAAGGRRALRGVGAGRARRRGDGADRARRHRHRHRAAGDRAAAARRLPRPRRRLRRGRGRDAAPRRLPAASAYGRQAGAFAIDLVLVVVAYYAAYRLRFEQTYAVEQPLFVASLPFVVAAKMVAFAVLRTYQGLWRHTSLASIVRLAQAVVLGGVLSVLAVAGDLPVPRLLARAVRRRRGPAVPVPGRQPRRRPPDGRGAAAAADRAQAGRDLRRRRGRADGAARDPIERRARPRSGRVPRRRSGAGADRRPRPRVAGGSDRLEDVLRSTPVAEVVVSSTRIAPERLAQVRDVCDAHGVAVVRSVLRFE